MTGTGIIEPIDDIRAGNPPTNPELLDWLTAQFIESGFDVRHIVKIITKSRTYQLSVKTNKWNEDDTTNYSHAKARRLPAEVLLDSIYRVTGTPIKFPGVAEGTRAAQLPDVGVKLADGFLGNLGRPARESACECERSTELQTWLDHVTWSADQRWTMRSFPVTTLSPSSLPPRLTMRK